MEPLLGILTELSGIVGVPVTLAFAWAAFIIHEHSKQIKQLKAELAAVKAKADDDLEELEKKFEKELKVIVEKFEAKFEAAARDQKEELRAIYNKIDTIAKSINTIEGYMFKGRDRGA